MWLISLFALVLAGGCLLVQALMGGDHHAAAPSGLDAHAPEGGAHPLSSRGLLFGVFGFGLVGTALTGLRLVSDPVAALLAVACGLASGLGAGLAFRTLGDPRASGTIALQDAWGREARVVVALSPEQRGKVRLELKGQIVDMFAVSDEGALAEGTEVVVIGVDEDVARVASSGRVRQA